MCTNTAEHPRGLFLALSTRAWWESALPAEAPETTEAILTALRRRYLLTGLLPVAAALAIVFLAIVFLQDPSSLTGGPGLTAIGLAVLAAAMVLGWLNGPATSASVQMRYPYDRGRGMQGTTASGDETADFVLWPFRSGTARPIGIPAETTEATAITVLKPTWPTLPHQRRAGLTMVFIPGATEDDFLNHPQEIGSILAHLLELHRTEPTDRTLPGVVATQAQIQRIHDQLADPTQLNYQSTRHQH